MRVPRIADSTVARLCSYHRILEELAQEGRRLVSSRRLAERAGVTSAQVRKDLSYFGTFGRRGLGYHVQRLHEELRAILGLDRRWDCALVGAGHIARALYSYQDFRRRGFHFVAIFDTNEELVGQRWGEVEIQHVRRLVPEVRRLGVRLGVVATPARAAQEAVDLLVAAGVTGVLNFAPRKLNVPPEVHLRNVNMAIEFESLAYSLRAAEARGRRRRAVPVEE
ncbi:MAG TPA: redox-sensing transcriptional repressor Rex [Candidatus Saccharimonadales bacterium]|nr:redox-sensing transcriptional repressor Rex [Candidatus Saccharimonadales bacterium]